MKFTGITALFAAVTAVNAAPVGVNTGIANVDLGTRDVGVQASADGVHIDAKRQDLLEGLGVNQILGNAIKRDADVTEVATNLLPELKKMNILPGSIGVEQLTKTLDVLNVEGLLGNVTPLLNNLVGGLVGGLLGGVLGGGQGGGGQITQVAGSLLPKVTSILPGVGQEQLGGLLNVLGQNGALKDLTKIVPV